MLTGWLSPAEQRRAESSIFGWSDTGSAGGDTTSMEGGSDEHGWNNIKSETELNNSVKNEKNYTSIRSIQQQQSANLGVPLPKAGQLAEDTEIQLSSKRIRR